MERGLYSLAAAMALGCLTALAGCGDKDGEAAAGSEDGGSGSDGADGADGADDGSDVELGDPTAGRYRVDGGRSGSVDAAGPTGTLAWTVTESLEIHPEDELYGPVVTGDQIIAVGLAGTVTSAQRSDGQEQWSWSTSSDEVEGLGVGPQHVVIAVEAPDNSDRLTLLSKENGGEVWTVETEDRGGRWLSLVDDRVIGATHATVEARQLSDGAVVWSRELASHYVFGERHLAVSGSTIIGTDAEAYFALRVSDGQEQWSRAVGADGASPPVVADNALYAAVDCYRSSPCAGTTPGSLNRYGQVFSVDVSTGADRWSRTLEDFAPHSPPVVGHGLVVVRGDFLTFGGDSGDTDESRGLLALSASDGSEVARVEGPNCSVDMVLFSDMLVCVERGSEPPEVVALNPRDRFSRLWAVPLPGPAGEVELSHVSGVGATAGEVYVRVTYEESPNSRILGAIR